LLAALPLSTLADLNKGEMVLIVGSSGADLSQVTIISQLAGDSAVIKKLQQLMWPNQDAQEMNTGLPGDVLGDGTVVVDHPKTRPDPPL
jgi:hypothetical protein